MNRPLKQTVRNHFEQHSLSTDQFERLEALMDVNTPIPAGRRHRARPLLGWSAATAIAVLLAIISAYQEKPLPPDMALFGEVGLTGEIRPVGNHEARAREAANLGFSKLLLPRENETRVQESNLAATLRKSAVGLTCLPAKHLSEAVQIALN